MNEIAQAPDHKGSNLQPGGEQWVSIVTTGNVPEPAPTLVLHPAGLLNGTNMALSWPAVVGRGYQILYCDDVATGQWLEATGEISATKTNVAVVVPLPSAATSRFWRLIELH